MKPVEYGVERASRNVGQWERWGSVAAGAALLAYGLRRRKKTGAGMVLAAMPLLERGVTGHCRLYDRIGVNRADHSDTRRALGGSAGVHIDESIVINKPVRDVYLFWRRLENLPLFMSNLESVTETSTTRSHWVAKGPAGLRLEWDAEIINDIDGQLIAWRSVDQADVVSAGSAHFERAEDEPGTLVTVRMQYSPPAGKLGAAMSSLLGKNPSQMVQDDLRRLKDRLEMPF